MRQRPKDEEKLDEEELIEKLVAEASEEELDQKRVLLKTIMDATMDNLEMWKRQGKKGGINVMPAGVAEIKKVILRSNKEKGDSVFFNVSDSLHTLDKDEIDGLLNEIARIAAAHKKGNDTMQSIFYGAIVDARDTVNRYYDDINHKTDELKIYINRIEEIKNLKPITDEKKELLDLVKKTVKQEFWKKQGLGIFHNKVPSGIKEMRKMFDSKSFSEWEESSFIEKLVSKKTGRTEKNMQNDFYKLIAKAFREIRHEQHDEFKKTLAEIEKLCTDVDASLKRVPPSQKSKR